MKEREGSDMKLAVLRVALHLTPRHQGVLAAGI